MNGVSTKFLVLGSAVVIGSALLAVAISDGHLMGRCLVVHTDDAGMCHSMNRATIDCLEGGLVTSASIMAPCPGFEEFAEWAAAHPEYDYGVHLTLTNETTRFSWGPVLPVSEVPSLVTEQGNFWSSSEEVAEHVSLQDVDRELRAQIDRVLEAGIQVTHLDNHMYSLLGREDLINLYVQLALDYDLPVRFRDVATMPLDQRAKFYGGLLDTYNDAGRKLWKHGMPLFTFAEANNYDVEPDDKRNYFIEVVRDLPPGVSEFVIHCGYRGTDGMDPPGVNRRVEDSRVFQSPDMRHELNRLGVRLLNWEQFRKQDAAARP